MNWGQGIAIFLAVFVMSMLGLVYMTTQSNVDLEAEDYYAQEIGYQNRINAIAAGAQYEDLLIIESQPEAVQVRMKDALQKNFGQGKIYFFRPNDASLDREFVLELSDGQAAFSRSEFVKGNYEVRLEWTADEVPHVIKRKVSIP